MSVRISDDRAVKKYFLGETTLKKESGKTNSLG
jgi:hypothetical protein